MADSEAQGGDVFEIDRIRSLVELMKEFDLRQIDLRQANQRICLCRGSELAPPADAVSPAAVMFQPNVSQAFSTPAARHPASAPGGTPEEEHIVYIRSPMVGTFYSRPNPTAEPYVSVGDRVEPETTICVIEAMKVFNEIPAEIGGQLVAVLVEDEEPVEYGKPLFKIDTTV